MFVNGIEFIAYPNGEVSYPLPDDLLANTLTLKSPDDDTITETLTYDTLYKLNQFDLAKDYNPKFDAFSFLLHDEVIFSYEDQVKQKQTFVSIDDVNKQITYTSNGDSLTLGLNDMKYPTSVVVWDAGLSNSVEIAYEKALEQSRIREGITFEKVEQTQELDANNNIITVTNTYDT